MERKWILKNYETGLKSFDTFHQTRNLEKNACTATTCKGSMVQLPGPEDKPISRSKASVRDMAKDFCDEYFTTNNRYGSTEHVRRWEEINNAINTTGTYHLTEEELLYGAKLSWRNASRCIGRIHWNNLHLIDARDVATPRQMFEAICTHLLYATNNGNIRSAITVFRQREQGREDHRVWNSELIGYAGYRNDDESITGDPASIEFTKVCQELGWTSERTMWDVLPLVLSTGGDPELFDIPPELVLQVPLTHPSYAWFKELNLRWFAVPAVSGMLFDVGGIQFPACPFNGWYMSTEIGCRDLCDKQRYNVLERVASEMGEETNHNATLWRDRALVEVNAAVLHSFQKMAVTLVDHHTASENFMKFIEYEKVQRKGCPADWVWLVPPMSGSLSPLFHQEMAMYIIKPSFDYQVPAWITHNWKNSVEKAYRTRMTFKQLATNVRVCSVLYNNVMSRRVNVAILYASETGKSHNFALKVAKIFSCRLKPKVYCMLDYNPANLFEEGLVLIVTSTFGNGDSPGNGTDFMAKLRTLLQQRQIHETNDLDSDNNVSSDTTKASTPLRFSVFALGSSVYPNFCAFGHNLDKALTELGAERLMPVAEADEMRGQVKAFMTWSTELYPLCCRTFGVQASQEELDQEMETCHDKVGKDRLRLVQATGLLTEPAICKAIQNNGVKTCQVLRKTNLHSDEYHGSTILLEMECDVAYQPGDHVGIMPENRAELVDGLLKRLESVGNPDMPVKLQVLEEKRSVRGTTERWSPYLSYPSCSLRTLLTTFLDITTPFWPSQLEYLSTLTTNKQEQTKLLQLAQDNDMYEEWRSWSMPTVLDVLQQFPSIRIVPTLLISCLKPMCPRYYSISSSPAACPGQIHITVAVVSYRTEEGGGPTRYGVCSNYLNRCKSGDQVYLFIRSARNFSLPKDVSAPVIMVGPGTGIAPFRGFWQERDSQLRNTPPGATPPKFGPTWLFFGCKTRGTNLYAKEREEMLKKGIIQKEFCGFSREQGVPKTYVQTLITQEGGPVYRALSEENGHLYVCGEVAMAEGVQKKLRMIAESHGNMSAEESAMFIKKLKEEKRYHEDIFGVTTKGIDRRSLGGKHSETKRKGAVTSDLGVTRRLTPTVRDQERTSRRISNCSVS